MKVLLILLHLNLLSFCYAESLEPIEVKVTFYWTVFPENESGEEKIVKGPKGEVIGRVPASLYTKLVTEGSGYLPKDENNPHERLVNLGCACDEDEAFFINVDTSIAPWGLDSIGKPLMPFKSIAIDKEIIPLGTKVYIPALVGIKLKDKQHDGCVFAGDTGPAIKGNRIDIFSGTHANYLQQESRLNLKTIEIYPNHPNC